jgi:hypothetical protein
VDSPRSAYCLSQQREYVQEVETHMRCTYYPYCSHCGLLHVLVAFVLGLQGDFSHTVHTVLRTVDKLSADLGAVSPILCPLCSRSVPLLLVLMLIRLRLFFCFLNSSFSLLFQLSLSLSLVSFP